MCVDKLVVKKTLLCPESGTQFKIVFSITGMSSPYKYLSILLKTSGQFTFRLNKGNQEIALKSGQGTGEYQFCVIPDLDLQGNFVYELNCSSTALINTYQIDLAEVCLCDPVDC